MAGMTISTAAWEHKPWPQGETPAAGYQSPKPGHRSDCRQVCCQGAWCLEAWELAEPELEMELAAWVPEPADSVSAGAEQVGRAYCPACSRL